MPKFYEYQYDGSVVEYDIDAVKCPVYGWPVAGYFQNGKLMKVGLCIMCPQYGRDCPLEHVERYTKPQQ